MATSPENYSGGGSRTPNEYERIVILANPGSTRLAKGDEGNRTIDTQLGLRIANIVTQNIAPPLYLETSGNRVDDQDMLKRTLKTGDALCIAGGDGTVNIAVNALMDEDLEGIMVPVLPLWGGDVNDLARGLNGSPSLFPSQILKYGEPVPLHAIRWDVEHDDNPMVMRAALYSGAGTTGVTAGRFNGLRKRPGYNIDPIRRMHQGQVMLSKLVHRDEIEIRDQDGERTLNDLTVVSNEVMAKVLRFPVSIREPRLFRTEVDTKTHFGVSRWIGRSATGSLRPEQHGWYIESGESYDFDLLSPAVAHFDNETELLLPDSHITITQEARPFYGLSLPQQVE